MSMISELVEELIDNADSYTKELHDLMYRAADTIEMLSEKAREPKQEWIPCSERLPEYRKLVDITTRDLRVKLAYLDSVKEDGTDDLWVMPLEDAECALWNIVAWMPLPKPWEGADNEDDQNMDSRDGSGR